MLKSSANQIGKLQSDHIQSHKSVIALQDELINSKTEQIAAVHREEGDPGCCDKANNPTGSEDSSH